MKTRVWKALAVLAVLIASIAVWALPTKTYAAEGDVARIESTGVEYKTLDEAIADAADGDTITLLGDADTAGMSLYKSLTIQADETLASKPVITFTQYGIAMNYGQNNDIELAFKGVDVVMTGIGSTPAKGEWNWMSICASGNADITLDNANMTLDGTGASGSPHAMYFTGNNVLNVLNGSNLTIKNYANDALEWNGGDGGYNVNIIDSTFVSDHNRSGFTGTFYATITNSDVDVINSTGNGSNGSHFIITNSTVDFNDNGSHGLSAGELSIDNSIVNANNNHGMGITVNNNFTVKNGSEVTVTGNADNTSYGYAAVRLYNDYEFSVDATSMLHINDNNNTGLYVRQGNLNVAEGADFQIMRNKVTHTLLDGYGGGLYVGYGDNYDPVVTLPDDAVIYNNHSLNGGDDIYVSEGVEGPQLTFGPTGSDWALDGDPDCTDAIDGWYIDAEGARWEAHASDPADNIVELYPVGGTTTVEGPVALKAAHGITATFTPADITIYMGGTEGYESVVQGSQGTGDVVDSESNSLPEPGFYIELPECINNALKAEVGDTPGAVDLSQYITMRTRDNSRSWTLEMYGATNSVAYDRFVYRVVSPEGQDPVRLQFTSGDQFFVSDEFDPSTVGALSNQYVMGVYPGEVDQKNIVMDVEIGGKTYTYTVELETGMLNVRYVTGEQAEVVTDVLASIEDAIAPGERAYAVAPEDTRYTINESNIDVTDSAAPSLLFDDVVTDDNTAGAEAYDDQLATRAQAVAEQAGADFAQPAYEAKYLDLVDANNGNVWIKASEPVTVYWPYPAGTDESTEFHLVHFEGLDRELSNGEISGAIDSANAVYVEVENTEHGVRFTTDGFSPFVLMWDASEPTTPTTPSEPSEPAKPSDNLAATGDPTMLAVVAAAAGGTLCLVASRIVKKHRDK